MSPPKLTSKYKAIGATGTPGKPCACKASANSPMTSTDWRRSSSETVTKSNRSSPVLSDIADDTIARGNDSDDDGKNTLTAFLSRTMHFSCDIPFLVLVPLHACLPRCRLLRLDR